MCRRHHTYNTLLFYTVDIRFRFEINFPALVELWHFYINEMQLFILTDISFPITNLMDSFDCEQSIFWTIINTKLSSRTTTHCKLK